MEFEIGRAGRRNEGMGGSIRLTFELGWPDVLGNQLKNQNDDDDEEEEEEQDLVR